MHLGDSTISTSVLGGAWGGGNVTIDPVYVILQNSQILVQAVLEQGGNIDIIADVLLMDSTSIVDASSQFGLSGSVTIQSPLSNLSGALVPMPEAPLQIAALLQ